MADLKITGLDPLAEGSIQSTDVLAIADISATETKKVTVKDLVAAAAQFLDAGDIPAAKVGSGISAGSLADGSVTNVKLANDSVSFGGVSVDLGAADATPAFNLSDATAYPTSALVGTITNAQLAGSIANAKLANSSVSLGGITVALGASDATPAFDLTDATSYKTTNLVGTITNAQLAGSIDVSKLVGSNVNFGGVTVALGGSDTTPAFNLSDATNYPTSALVGTITNAQLAGSIANTKLVANSITANELAANSVTDSELANLSVATGSVQDGAITNDKVQTSTNSSTGLDGATKIRDATITPAKLNSSNLDRSLNIASGNLGINNVITAGTRSGITFNAQGLVTSTAALGASDLPIATSSAVGGVSVGTGLSVNGSGVLSLSNSVTGATVSGITFSNTGQITAATALVAGDLPVSTTSAKGAVQITSGGGLTVDGSGNLTTSTSGISAGTYQSITVNNKGVATAGAALTAALIPDLAASKITSGTLDGARIANDSIDSSKLSNSSTTVIQSIAQLGYPTAAFTGQLLFDPIAEDAYLWDGNAWNPITTLTKGALVRLGTYNANLSQVDYVTAAGSAAGLTVGQNLPVASESVDGGYVVISVQGTPSGVAGITGQLQPPDYLLGVTASSTSSSWVEIDLSTTVASQQASAISYQAHGQLSSTNVQLAINELEDEKLAKAGGTVTGEVLIGSTGSLVFEGSTVDAFETKLTVADPTTSDKTITLPNVTGTVITSGDTNTVTKDMVDGSLINTNIAANAGIAFTKLAALTSAQILVGNGSNEVTAVAVTGDISINNAGLTAIASGVIVDGDISGSAAITGSKIATGTTSAVGVLQLTDAADSTSTTTAATPAAVKIAKDAADAAATTANAALPTTGGTLTGNLILDNAKELRLSEADGDGANYTGLKAQAQSGDITLTLPAVAPTANQVLKADASTPTTLTWASDSATDNTKMPLAGGTFTNDVTFTGDSSNGLWDKSASAFVANLTGNVTGNVSGSAATVTGAAQSAITSLGTLTGLTVNSGTTNTCATFQSTDAGAAINLTDDSARSTIEQNGTDLKIIADTDASDADSTIKFQVDASTKMTILSSGDVVVGATVSDSFKFKVTNGSGTLARFTDGSSQTLDIRQATGGIELQNPNDGFISFKGASAERMRIDSSGRLLVGQTTADTDLGGFLQIAGNSYAASSTLQARLTADAHGCAIDLLKSRNTTWGSHTIVQDNDRLGSIFFRGDDGVNYAAAASAIYGEVDGTPGADDMPGRLTFLTSADGNDALIERMRIDSSGRLLLGTTTEGHTNADDLTIAGSGTQGITIRSGTANSGNIFFSDATSGAAEFAGYVQYAHGTNSLTFGTNGGTLALTLNSSQNATFAGTVSDSKGNLRSIPYVAKTSQYELVAADAGKCISSNSGGWIIPNNEMSAGDAVTLINVTTGDLTIEQESGLNMYFANDGTTGDRTLAKRGVATVYFLSGGGASITGAGLS
jgi:hypothetical protein